MDTSALPTKNNLMKIKSKLNLSMQGHDLLEKKKIILEMEKEKYAKKMKEKKEKLNELFINGIEKIKMASVDIGMEELKNITEEIDFNEKIDIKYKTVMGVEIPSIIYEKPQKELKYGLYNTSIQVDEVIETFNEIKKATIELAELENTILRINKAVEKVKKRSNALKDIIIPEDIEKIKKIHTRRKRKRRIFKTKNNKENKIKLYK